MKYNIESFVKDKLYAGIVGHNTKIKNKKCFNKEVLEFDGIKDKNMAEAYWKLDVNAFGGKNMAAPKYMKMDTLIAGGIPVGIFVDEKYVCGRLKKELGDGLKHYPIGFIDLHNKDGKNFATSGLGIAKHYQGMGLSKYLISAGMHLTGADSLLIPTQVSNKPAINAWKVLGSLEIISNDLFHEEKDSILYKAKDIQKLNLSKYTLEK